MNIPNTLTFMRFLLVPAFIFFFFSDLDTRYIISAAIFVFAGITDVLDGYIARKYDMITKWGKLLDPLADKIMQLSAIICLAVDRLIPLWAIYVILIKEILMILGSVVLYKDKIVVGANWYGKVSTVLLHLSILAIILIDLRDWQKMLLIILALGSSIFALIKYSLNFKHIKFPYK